MRKKTESLALAVVMIMALMAFTVACADVSLHAPEAPGDINGELLLDYEEELKYAGEFTLTRYKGGYSVFTIPNTMGDRQYLIVPEDKKVPEKLPENTVVLQQPIDKICFASGGMASLAEAIGAVNCIKTVAIDVDGWIIESIIAGLENGKIKYSGKFREPDFEMLLNEEVQLEIDTAMLLNYQEIIKKYDELGIPYFMESSSMESHPLGRMEWVKLLGAILGLDQEAKAYFDIAEAKVNAVAATEKCNKTAALFYIGGDTVYVRSAGDYISAMLNLAGGDLITADIGVGQGGNIKLNFEEFYAHCKDADYLFWIVLSCPYTTLDELVESNALFADFEAVQNGNVYTSRRGFAQSTAYFADVIAEMHRILNDASIGETKTFVKLK